MSRRSLAFGLALGLAACERGGDAPPPIATSTAPAPWSEAWMLAEADRYLADAAFRRDVLERSLKNPDNLYSRARLSAYGRDDRGWDALPVWVPRTRAVDAEVVARLGRGEPPTLPAEAPPLWDGTRPQTMQAWVELGRRVFFEYPLRPEVFAEHGLPRPEIMRAAGLAAADDTWPGFVVFGDIDGRTRVGITCALCHSAVENGAVVAGRARRSFDYGQLRLAYHRDTGEPLAPELAARMHTWGPGRADITEDDDQDPVAIPDLWGIRDQSALTAAGTIEHVHPAALAIRQETQILHANRERTRPPRELAWALAMYVYALTPPARDAPPEDPALPHGEDLFGKHCGSCHDNAALGGDPIPAERVGTDPTLAFGAARGTGTYRPSPLLRIADGAPYLHHGVVADLNELLDDARFQPDYDRGTRGAGPIPGHAYGTDLPEDDRAALIAFLRTR